MKNSNLLLMVFLLFLFSMTFLICEHITVTSFLVDKVIYQKNESLSGLKLVAFTFDDGPSITTEKLLDELKMRNVKATFFVLGEKCEKFPLILKKIADDGHQVGVHSYNHRNFYGLNIAQLDFQVNSTVNIIKKITGKVPNILRPSYGNVSKNIKKVSSLPIILWSIDTKDWKIKSPKRLFENNIDKIGDGDIVLFHDIFESSIDGALMLIDALKKRNFIFVTIDEIAFLKNRPLNKSEVYFNFFDN